LLCGLLQVAAYQVACQAAQQAAGAADPQVPPAYLVLIGRDDFKVAVVRVSPANVCVAREEWGRWWASNDKMPFIVDLLNRCGSVGAGLDGG
jgi:hypothetical protein